ncbi:MAG: PhnD/SsuA/transferrin family substrate-binding protein [Anaerolineaceae bacterium]|nr:PhnD/SsuA/transferrin family substrate-binding protein [Anaerolineaceae bacterium]
MAKRKLHALTFLAPNMLSVYRFTLDYVSRKLGCEIELTVGTDYREIFQVDLAFICGLPYVLYTSPHFAHSPIEALTAPVLQHERFQNRPIYFSDVIVHRDSPFHSFADLRGCSWAYNEPQSQSGYGITRYWLVQRGETNGYFREVVQSGFHQKSIRMVCRREVDASAIDAQVLAIEMRDHPQFAEKLRVIDSFGPSTIQPLAAACRLPKALKQDIQAIFAEIHREATSRAHLDKGFIDHFATVSDADYDDIRAMLTACEQAGFLWLK